MKRVTKAELVDVFGNTYGYMEGNPMTEDEQLLVTNVCDKKIWTVLMIVGKGSEQARLALQVMNEYSKHVDPDILLHGNKAALIFVSKRPLLVARPEFMGFCEKAHIVTPKHILN